VQLRYGILRYPIVRSAVLYNVRTLTSKWGLPSPTLRTVRLRDEAGGKTHPLPFPNRCPTLNRRRYSRVSPACSSPHRCWRGVGV
jgi:hypothetical protein